MKPMPVRSPCQTRDSASGDGPNASRAAIRKAHVEDRHEREGAQPGAPLSLFAVPRDRQGQQERDQELTEMDRGVGKVFHQMSIPDPIMASAARRVTALKKKKKKLQKVRRATHSR